MVHHIKLIFSVILVALVSSCATAPVAQEKRTPVEVGKTKYKDQIIPVFDAKSVQCDRTVAPAYPDAQRRERVEGDAVVMIIVDESGKAVEVGTISSQPSPEFGFAALEAAKRWRYYPLCDASGHPMLHALRMPVSFRISESFEYHYLSR